MTSVQSISRSQALRLIFKAQLLDYRRKFPRGRKGLAQLIDHLGYIQIDTISVIRRAHHHTLWSRRGDYRSSMLWKLLRDDRRIFEYWGHAASFLPIDDYRFYLPRMRRMADPGGSWHRERLEKHRHMMQPVLERIKNEGPLSSKDFDPPPGKKRGSWWDWKPAKIVLELLFWQGDLMVTERQKFQRCYDLTERVLPSHIDTRYPDEIELGRFFVRRALQAQGVGTEKDIWEHLHGLSRTAVQKAIQILLEDGEIEQVSVTEIPGPLFYTLRGALENIPARTAFRLHILSPFDNSIILRDRIQKLTGFDYRLECYLPSEKRKFGYFVLPVLWGIDFVGRLDAKAHRADGILEIKVLHLEAVPKNNHRFWAALSQRLQDFARFNGCSKLNLRSVKPGLWDQPLRNSLESGMEVV